MTEVLGFTAWLMVPLVGLAVWHLADLRQLALDGRIAIAGVAGALVIATLMAVMALVGVEWSRTRLVLALLIPVVIGSRALPRRSSMKLSWPSPALAGVVILLAITTYGLVTGRETSGDLLFFWGPKAVHFHHAGTIDVEYLRDPNNFLAHRDYPPLLPLLYAWSMTISRRFSWWSAVLSSGLCLAGIVAIVRTFARDNLAALMTASILAWCFTICHLAGGADPLLLLFEATAICAIVFLREGRTGTVLTAIALAGAVTIKVEGLNFAVAMFAVMVLDRRPLKRIAAVALPAVVFLGAWLLFVVRGGLLDTYRGAGAFTFAHFAKVVWSTLHAASYETYWLPWIAPLAVVLLGNIRRALLPLTAAILMAGATIFYYLHGPVDPSTFWIPASAPRVLLTPLVMLLIAAAAAHAPPLAGVPGSTTAVFSHALNGRDEPR